jgi:glutamyl-tRNA reductase
VDLREKIEDIRKRELDKTLGSLNGINEDGKRAIDVMSQSIVNKLLHAPLVVLKQAASTQDGSDNTIAVARKLFNLDKELKRPGHHRSDMNVEASEDTGETRQGNEKKSECR